MKAYFIRRLILLPVTLLGITFMVFMITRLAPGGPLQQMIMANRENAGSEGAGKTENGGLSDEEIEAAEEEFGVDKPAAYAYGQWLGVLPRENFISKLEYSEEYGVQRDAEAGTEQVRIVLKGEDRVAQVTRKGDTLVSAIYEDSGENVESGGWIVRLENADMRNERRRRREGKDSEDVNYPHRAVVFKESFAGLLQGDLRKSRNYQDDVWAMILERVPVALYFGLLSAIITYGISLPLGVVKAIRHRTFVDNATSVLIFVGYAIPGFALGGVLLVWLGANHQLFPLIGLTSQEFDSLSLWGKFLDLAHHTVLPLTCYVVGGFAYTTMMMKNNLMDNLAADYVRTAMAKGVNFRRAVFGHAFRNSMIPIATTLGQLITLFVGGSILVERVFDINGFGQLQLLSVENKDIPLVMGLLTVSAGLMLLGNIISDLIVAWIDPRIKFN